MTTTETTTTWKEVPSFPGYFVSTKGQVRGRRGKIMRGRLNKGGYIEGTFHREGRQYCRRFHGVICEAFHGPRPPHHQVAHRDGCRTNNAPNNLRWATAGENSADKIGHGTLLAGEEHPRASMTAAVVRSIRLAYKAEIGNLYVRRGFRRNVADRYGITVSAVKDILSGRSWKSPECYP